MLAVLYRPLWVRGAAVLADAATGMVMPSGTGPAPVSYEAVSSPGATLAEVSPADRIDHTQAAGGETELPPDSSASLRTVLRYLGSITGRRPQASIGFVSAVVAALVHGDRRVVGSGAAAAEGRPAGATDPGGTALAQVINAVTVDRAATPEQFATFVAVAARAVGIPARLVTGFRLTPSSGGRAIPAGRYEVTGGEAWTWLEVPVAGMGWVVVDPTPEATTASPQPPPEPSQATPTTLPASRAAIGLPALSGSHPLARPVAIARRRPSGGGWRSSPGALLAVGVIALAAGAPLQAAIRRRRRRSRRFSDDPSELAVGAWLELLDGLWRAGMRPDPAATGSEIAVGARDHFGVSVETPVADVAAVADRALFHPRGVTDMSDARRAWILQQSVTREATATLDRRQRLRAVLRVGAYPVSPRPTLHPGFEGLPRRFGARKVRSDTRATADDAAR
jgi:hypothetical protein